MNYKLITAAIVFAGLMLACSSSPDVTYDQGLDFSPPKSFTWLDDQPLKYSATDNNVNPFLEDYLMEATKTQLEAKGYRFVEKSGNPDFSVAFTFGAREKIQVSSYPGGVRYGGGSPGRRDYWGPGPTQTRSYTEGQLSIDVFSESSKEPAWHGTDTGTVISKSGDELREAVDEQIARMLKEFPPGK